MRWFRFGLVGAFNTILSAAVFAALYRTLPVGPPFTALSQAASYGAGVLIGYTLHRRFTFEASPERPRRALVRFIIVDLLLALSTAAVLAVAIDRFGFAARLSWCAVALIATAAKYQLVKRFVFRPPRQVRLEMVNQGR